MLFRSGTAPVLHARGAGPAFCDKRVSDQRSDACFRGRMLHPPQPRFAKVSPTRPGAAAPVLSLHRRRAVSAIHAVVPRRGRSQERMHAEVGTPCRAQAAMGALGGLRSLLRGPALGARQSRTTLRRRGRDYGPRWRSLAVSANRQTKSRCARQSQIASGTVGASRSREPIASAAKRPACCACSIRPGGSSVSEAVCSAAAAWS